MKVVIARQLLQSGLDELDNSHEVVSGGLHGTRDALLDLVPGADAIISDPTVPVNFELLSAAGPQVKVVANFAVGYDNIDLSTCHDRGIVVTNTPDVLTNATAELAVGLTLAAARQITDSERRMRAGQWKGWDPADYLGFELSGSTIGVVGMGRIGQRYAELMSPFADRILYTSRSSKPDLESELQAHRVELDELLEHADVVSLHVPATPETNHLINARTLGLMKDTAILVNTGRGNLVDSEALAEALENGTVGAAGLDVYEGEPTVPQCLLDAPRTAMTPHIGSATHRSRDDMARLVARNVNGVLNGTGPVTKVETTRGFFSGPQADN